MTLRPNAQFLSGFPDDMVEEDGEIVTYPGQQVANALRAMLRAAGYTAPEAEASDRCGWEFDVPLKTGSVWVEVVDIGETFVLQTVYRRNFFASGGEAPHATLLEVLAKGMAADGRFDTVVWRPRGEVESDEPGAAWPTGPVEMIAPKRLE